MRKRKKPSSPVRRDTTALEEAIIDYDALDQADDLQALRQAYLQAYGATMSETELLPYAGALAAGKLTRLAAVLELVDAARGDGRIIHLRFGQPIQNYLSGLSGSISGSGWTRPHNMRVVDLSDLGAFDDAAFIRFGYLQILGKPVDPEGLAHYLYRMQNGSTRFDVLRALAQAAKCDGETVTFQLRADALSWLGQNQVASLKSLLAGGDEDCVRALYQTILGKAADAPGLAHYLWQLSTGRTRFSIYLELRAVATREGRCVIVDCDLEPDHSDWQPTG